MLELEEKLLKQLGDINCLDTRDIGPARPNGKLHIFNKEETAV